MTDVQNLISFHLFGSSDNLVNNDNCLKAMFIGSLIVLIILIIYAITEFICDWKHAFNRETMTEEESNFIRSHIIEI